MRGRGQRRASSSIMMVWATHEELAALTRVSREEVTRRVLPDLKGRGLIAYEQRHRGISVRDSAGLLDLATRGM